MSVTSNFKGKILVVDDMDSHRQNLFNILNQKRYFVSLAKDGNEAIQQMTNEEFDLILLDVEMPGISGFDVCQYMREDEVLKEIPVIFVTSYGKIENRVSGFGIGAQDFITKPFHEQELLGRINTHLLLKHKSDQIKRMNFILEEKNKSITQSIEYAKYIQQSILPSLKQLDGFIDEKFLINKPKDIIGGDFIWFKQTDAILNLAVADSTGHGVPGALMSVLGISLINEILGNDTVDSPANFLNKLRSKLIGTLNKKNKDLHSNDGLDIGMCTVDFENMKIKFAGANIPLFIFRYDKSRNSYELIKRNCDKMPIGNHPLMNKSYTDHILELQGNDRIYLFTDGYASQFGGEFNKTFKTKRLVNYLLEIQHLSFKEQKLSLENTFNNWAGKNSQVDDILIFGFEVPIKN